MKNFVQRGVDMNYANATGDDIKSGDVVPLPVGIGIAATDITDGDTGTVTVEGVFQVKKAAPLVIAQGAKLFWDAGAKKLTTTAGANALAGYAFEAALSADTVVLVKLVALGEKDSSGTMSEAGHIAKLGTTSNLVGVDGTANDAAPLVGTEARLDAIEAKIDALIQALYDAGLMASS